MSAMVINPQVPHGDEAFLGYMHRLAAENGFPSTGPFFRLLGQPKGVLASAEHIHDELELWSQRLDVDQEHLRQLLPRVVRYKQNGIELRGVGMGEHLVLRSYRRVSPDALKISPHHRFNWDIAPLNFCPVTWDLLMANCPSCSSELCWQHTAAPARCGECGADLREGVAPKILPQHREDLAFASDLVSVDELRQYRALLQLPPNIRSLNRGAIIELALVLGWSDGKLARFDTAQCANPFQAYPHDLVAGIKILRNFSEAMEERIPMQSLLPKFLLNLRDYSRAVVSPPTRQFVSDLFESYCVEGNNTLERIKLARAQRSKLNLTQAAELMRVEKAVVRSLVEANLMKGYRIKDWQRRTDWFEEIEVARVGDILANKIDINDAIGQTGIPYHAFEQLCGLGVLHLNRSKIIRMAFAGRFFMGTAFETFVKRLRGRLIETPLDSTDRISLRTCFDGLGSQYKPWGAVLAAALTGKLPGGLGAYDTKGKLTARNLTVSRRLWDAIVSGLWAMEHVPQTARPYCSWAETEEYLNCLPRDVALLLSEFDLLHQVDHGSAGISRASVLAVGAEYISSAEIAARLSIKRLNVAKWARDQGLRRPEHGFPMWVRTDVEALLEPVPILFAHQQEPVIEVDLHGGERGDDDEDLSVA